MSEASTGPTRHTLRVGKNASLPFNAAAIKAGQSGVQCHRHPLMKPTAALPYSAIAQLPQHTNVHANQPMLAAPSSV